MAKKKTPPVVIQREQVVDTLPNPLTFNPANGLKQLPEQLPDPETRWALRVNAQGHLYQVRV